MYGEQLIAIPEAFHHSEYPSTEARMAQLNQWRKDTLIAYEYTHKHMKTRIRENYKPFSPAQKVWLDGRNLKLNYHKKITTKREGPFEITEVLSPLNYRLRILKGWKIHDVFHASLLTPYVETKVHGSNYPQPPPELINNEEEWEIERILRHKGTKNISYQVKWKGYKDTTWEPKKNLSNSSEALADYWKRLHKRTQK